MSGSLTPQRLLGFQRMAMLMGQSADVQLLLQSRKERGLDLYDEVWEGLYVLHAIPGDEHQDLVNELCFALTEIVVRTGHGRVRPGVNLASNAADWTNNYRIPDVVVFLNDNRSAVCHDAFWTGGPDLAVEILSPGDETPSKIDFYAEVGTRELLVIDRDPWRLDLHRHTGADLPVVSTCDIGGEPIASDSLPISLQLVDGEQRPRVIITHRETGREWTA